MTIRKTVTKLSFIVACAAMSASPFALANSDLLQKYNALCKRNIACSSHTMGDGTLFKIRMPARTSNILCKGDGSCEIRLPRGQSQNINNVEAHLSAR
jgi:hypothetical protein